MAEGNSERKSPQEIEPVLLSSLNTDNPPSQKENSLGSLLIKAGFIDNKRLNWALNVHRQKAALHDEEVAQILVNRGYLKKEILEMAMEECYLRKGKIGEYLVGKSLLSHKQLEKALNEQKKSHKRLGEQLVTLGYISRGLFYNILKRKVSFASLSAFLAKNEFVSEENLEKARQISRRGFRLGETLVQNGFITDGQLKMILSLQMGVPYKRLHNFTILEDQKKLLSKIISRETSDTHNIVPYKIEKNRVEVALNDVLHVGEIVSIGKDQGYNFYAFLVPDQDFKNLQNSLYSPVTAQERANEILAGYNRLKEGEKREESREGRRPLTYDFFQFISYFTWEYFNALQEAGFSEKQALEVLHQEARISLPAGRGENKGSPSVRELYTVTLTDPVKEEKEVSILYQNYIKGIVTSGEHMEGGREEHFREFIAKSHKEIVQQKGAEKVRYSLIQKRGTLTLLQTVERDSNTS